MTTDSPTVTIAIAQAAAVIGDVDQNLATLDRLVRQAASEGADIVVTPELFPTGYDPTTAWQHDNTAIRARLASLARDAGVLLSASTVDSESTPGSHYITAFVYSPEGEELARAHKHHLYASAERTHMTPGKYAAPFTWRGFTFGTGICYDVEYPEFVRAHALAGADILLIPTAVPTLESDGPDEAWRYSATQTSTQQVPTRALDNGVVIAYANHCAEGFTGHSCIATPFGRAAVMLDGDSEGIALVDVSLSEIERGRQVNTYLEDLRRLSADDAGAAARQ